MPHVAHPPCQAGIVLPRRVALVPLALAAALVVGCAPVDRAAQTPAPVLPSEAAPSPTPTPTPDLEPVRAFDGDCDQMLTSEQRDELLGAGSLTSAEQYRLGDADRPVAVDVDPIGTLGGLACTWSAGDGADLPEGVATLTATVVPAAEVTNEFAARYSVVTCEPQYDSTNCRLGQVFGAVWVGASAGWGPVEGAPDELLRAAVDAVAANLSAATQPRRAVATDDVWSIPDCADLGEAMGLEELIGPYLHGYWEGSEQPEEVLLAAAGVFRACPLFSDNERMDESDEFHIFAPQVAPGLGWQWLELRAQAAEPTLVEVDVAGAADAFAVDWGHGSHKAFATDGTNVVSVYESDLDLAAEVLSRMITALSS